MCGFVTVISKGGGEFPENTLKKMASMIVHRGPNDEGIAREGGWFSAAFRRLSILDLSPRGHQPMYSQDGRYAIIFNGEVYNYMEIRKELEFKGLSFNSGTDTEVILQSYIYWGKRCLERFNGMFAFVIADLRERKVFVARDQLGIKPLFHYEDASYHIFCSEVKALIPYKELEPDFSSVNEYLVFRSLPGDNTLFKDVESLSPGSFMELDIKGNCRKDFYFRLQDTFIPREGKTFQEYCDETELILRDSIKIHLRSDVELGVQLSGGVDSSLITAIASQNLKKKFHSFSISLEGPEFDESEYQQRVASRYGTEHHDYRFTASKFAEFMSPSIWHYEHPLNDPNTVATFYLTDRARKTITVMLSGEGADESFMGYTRFLPDSIRRTAFRTWFYNHKGVREFLGGAWPFEKGKDFFKITKYSPAMFNLSYSDLNHTDLLLKGDESSFKFRKSVTEAAGDDVVMQAAFNDQICDLMQWFWRADRIGMGSSMELRVPFCTVPMFRQANSIPYEFKVFGGERKAILKKVAEKYIDRDQIYRKKIGFGIPAGDWMRSGKGHFADLFREIMESEQIRKRPFINQEHFNYMYTAHKQGRYFERNASYLWTYFNLEYWYRIFFEGQWKAFIR